MCREVWGLGAGAWAARRASPGFAGADKSDASLARAGFHVGIILVFVFPRAEDQVGNLRARLSPTGVTLERAELMFLPLPPLTTRAGYPTCGASCGRHPGGLVFRAAWLRAGGEDVAQHLAHPGRRRQQRPAGRAVAGGARSGAPGHDWRLVSLPPRSVFVSRAFQGHQ